MTGASQLQTVTSDGLHHQHQLKEAVSLVTEQDTDLVIVSEDKHLLPCHSSLLALYSPVVARLLSGLPCCCTPSTIFLPDFQATHITKLLNLLRCGQAITGEDVFGDITTMEKIARVLQIPINTNDLTVVPYLDNPCGVPFQVMKELNRFNVKHEINSDVDESLERLETMSVRQEGIGESGSEQSPKKASPRMCGLEIEDEDVANSGSNDHHTQCPTTWIKQNVLDDMLIKTEVDQDNPESLVQSSNVDNTNTASINQEKIPDSLISIEENSYYGEMSTSSVNGIIPSISFSNDELDHSSSHIKRKASTHYNLPSKFHKINNNDTEIEIIEVHEFKSQEITEAVVKVLKKESSQSSEEEFPKFACDECTKSFSNAATLLVHKEKHGQSKGHRKCPLCNYSGVRTNLLTHTRAVHTKEKLFECTVCQKRFTTCGSKNDHQMRHPIENLVRAEKQPKEKLFECSVCAKKFFSSAMKNMHENTHIYQPKEKRFECSVCVKKFFSSAMKNMHENTHIYQAKEKQFECSVCKKKFFSPEIKDRHEKAHIYQPEQKLFQGNGQIDVDFRKDIERAEEPRQNSQVLKTRRRRSKEDQVKEKKAHQNTENRRKGSKEDTEKVAGTHHNSKLLKIGQRRSKEDIMKKNTYNITDPTQALQEGVLLSCKKCRFETKFKRLLSRHIQAEHDGVLNCPKLDDKAHNDDKYWCNKCDYNSIHKRTVKVHHETVHEKVKYPCNECEYEATQRSSLNNHIKSVHEGVIFACSKCEYEATAKRNLNRHVKSIHEGVKYPCSKCEYLASDKSTLNRHVKRKHDVDTGNKK